jgi:ribosomal protein S18 acetylase RimI-like enzyme
MTIVNRNQIEDRLDTDTDRLAIRAVKIEDIDYVAEIITHSFHFDRGMMGWFLPLFKLGIAEDLRYRLRNNTQTREIKPSPQICLAAVLTQWGQSRVVGTIEVSLRGTNDSLRDSSASRYKSDRGQYVYISNLAVSYDFRQRGIATELLQGCEDIARSWGHSDLYLHVMSDNDRARSLYTKMGYQLLSTELVWSLWPWQRTQRLFLHKPLMVSSEW